VDLRRRGAAASGAGEVRQRGRDGQVRRRGREGQAAHGSRAAGTPHRAPVAWTPQREGKAASMAGGVMTNTDAVLNTLLLIQN